MLCDLLMTVNCAPINAALVNRGLEVAVLALPKLPDTWMPHQVDVPPTYIRFLKGMGIIEQVTRQPVVVREKEPGEKRSVRHRSHEWRVTRLWYEWASYFQVLHNLEHTIHPLPVKKLKRNSYIPL